MCACGAACGGKPSVCRQVPEFLQFTIKNGVLRSEISNGLNIVMSTSFSEAYVSFDLGSSTLEILASANKNACPSQVQGSSE